MTSIGSISSSTTSTYISRLDTNGDGTVSADELAAASASSSKSTSTTTSSSSEEETSGVSAAATQLSNLLVSMILQMGGSETQDQQQDSGSDQENATQLSVSSLDSDGDGTVSAAEFAAAKPDDVTDEMSAQLFSALDSDGDGSVTEAELSVMRNGPPPPPSGGEADAADEEESGLFSISTLDTDGDGVVSAAEFAAAKPDDVSDEMSAQLFSALDADADGSVSESELSVMSNAAPPPLPPAGVDEASSTDEAISVADLLAELEEIAQKYLSSTSGDVDTTSALLTV